MVRIAVIGGGAAAVSLLHHLLARAGTVGPAMEICIYEPSHLAQGGAFVPDLDCALINQPNDSMSIRSTEPQHFLDWLADNSAHHSARETREFSKSYSPRWVFGDYLRAEYQRCHRDATALGWKITVHTETVTGISEGSDDAILVHSTENVRIFTRAVLAVGPGSPADPYRLAGVPGFHPTPYPLLEVLPKIRDPRAHILIIGTGLTAVDTAVGLLHLGHQGPITMASRRGILPEVRAATRKEPLTHLTREAIQSHIDSGRSLELADIWKMLRDEISSQGSEPHDTISWFDERISPSDYLRHQLTDTWDPVAQSIMMRIDSDLSRVTRSSMSDKALRHIATTLGPRLRSFQAPMPPRTARTLLGAVDTTQLRLVRGLRNISHHGQIFTADAASTVRGAQIVFDATHTSPARTKGRSRALIDSLQASGLASWDMYDGLRTEEATGRILLPSGKAHSRLYAIGEIVAGSAYYASSLPAVNRGASAVADATMRRLEVSA
ncbi:FAD/NAD(P)-binding protein [Streptomyces sp. NPDC048430]|uniref:FAD/NAD(P)-binding protein n=1 Tax=Streptomyces sp. NPDC048430 TaxID=3155388 RepID=UPI00342A3BBF